MLHISKNLKLPPEAMTLTSAILGIRGSGKTNTGVVFTEELLKLGQQVVIIDPLDVWYGLKSSADGKKPGHSIVVIGGIHGDLPLSEKDGAVLADFLVEHRAPAILSLRHLRKGEQKRFVADFAEQLYQRKGDSGRNTPLLVVIDEASAFVPQSFQGDSARMVGAIEDLVRRGRASGIGVMLIDQRAASVNKDVLTQLELLIAHRHTSPQDRAALRLWVQAHDTGEQEKTFMESQASLPRGEAWLWSPGWLNIFQRVLVRQRQTFDSSATPTLGQTPAEPQKLASVDLNELKAKLAATVEEAKANDPRELNHQIMELRQQLAAQPVLPQIERVEVPILQESEIARLEEVGHGIIAAAKDLHGIGNDILASVRVVSAPKDSQSSTRLAALQAVPMPAEATAITPKPRVEGVSPAQQRVLDAVACFERLGMIQVKRINAAFFAGYTENGHFNNLVGSLRTSGLLDYPAGGCVCLTDAGRAAANADAQNITTLRDLHEVWLNKISPSEAKLLRVLLEIYPRDIPRAELAKRTGYTENGHFNNMTGRLKTLGVAAYPRGGCVAATDVLFPRGLK